ncbi:hemophore-related protein [Mycolicibacterium sarraceniae]|uniref:Haemophore haem-binding domain-containing protein n=1 Tax=Mycolicibacterium sarraceniae TaxID=1534348 RepID=A0A7I7SQ17_9MYCO|nr:hemophore-related protein [Mycolicibacterium sarraceniae]BBY57916.1 hypothetical protein MSAR_10520 [Mycolicibacterium sarraceniae]
MWPTPAHPPCCLWCSPPPAEPGNTGSDARDVLFSGCRSSDCTAAGLSATVSSVTKNLSDYFAVHPDANQALIDATRQSGFSAIGACNSYFNDHPDQANDIRAIKAPLVDFQNRCGLQVEPAEALVDIGEL